MADDIVDRLVDRLRSTDYEYEDAVLHFDAADEIERLRADLAEAKVVLSKVRTGKLLLALEEEQSLSEQMFQAIDGLVNPLTDPNGYHPYLDRFRKAHATYKEFRETRPLIAQTVESVR